MFWIFKKKKQAELTVFELERDVMNESYRTFQCTLDVSDYVPGKMIKKDHRRIEKTRAKVRKKLFKKHKRKIGFWDTQSPRTVEQRELIQKIDKTTLETEAVVAEGKLVTVQKQLAMAKQPLAKGPDKVIGADQVKVTGPLTLGPAKKETDIQEKEQTNEKQAE
jgi:hypothetical protein